MSLLDEVAAKQGVKLERREDEPEIVRPEKVIEIPEPVVDEVPGVPGVSKHDWEVALQADIEESVAYQAREDAAMEDGIAGATLSHGSKERLIAWAEESVAHRYDEFLSSLASQYRRKGDLSDRQWNALRKSHARQAEWDRKRAEERADASPIPADVAGERVRLSGEIVSAKYKDTAFGTVPKMVVKEDRGFRVWGTIPEDLVDAGFNLQHGAVDADPGIERLVGQRVSLVARVKVSDDDDSFGFYSRPSGAKLEEAGEPVAISSAISSTTFGQVPAGGYGATQEEGGCDALIKLDDASPAERRFVAKDAKLADLARCYLTAEDANFHTLNVEVGEELERRLGPAWYRKINNRGGSISSGIRLDDAVPAAPPSVGIDYKAANKVIRAQKGALTRARKRGPEAVILEVAKAFRRWDEPDIYWPDAWHTWSIAYSDAMFELRGRDDFDPDSEIVAAVRYIEERL